MLFTRDLCSRWGGGQRPGAPGLAGCVLRERSRGGALLARRERPPAPDRRAPRVGVSESKGRSFRTGLRSVTRRGRELQEQVDILLSVTLEGLSRRLGWGVTASVLGPLGHLCAPGPPGSPGALLGLQPPCPSSPCSCLIYS